VRELAAAQAAKETDDPWNNHVRRRRPLAPGLTFLGRTATVAA